MRELRCRLNHFLGREGGSAAVEMAILVPILLLIIFGIIDFGHAWYMRQEITNASRAGARYGAQYHTDDNGFHLLPNALKPTIASWVTSQYGVLLKDGNLQIYPGGAGYTSGLAGDDLSVTVTATKTWWVISLLVPGMAHSVNLTASTVMKCE